MQSTLDIGSAANQGKRDYQQDSLGIRQEEDGSLLVVLADGMGGHNGGDIASKAAVKAFGSYFKNTKEKSIPNKLYGALHYANHAVCEIAKKTPSANDMGSTLIGLSIENEEVYWISVGDSLLYRIRDSQLEKLNEEHTLINHFKKLYAAGKISKSELEAVKDPHAITSSIGTEDLTEIDNPAMPVDLTPGDCFIIASDGLLTLDQQDIVNNVLHTKSAQNAADILIDKIKILNNPSQDNVTVIIVKVKDNSQKNGPMLVSSDYQGFLKWSRIAGGIGVIALVPILLLKYYFSDPIPASNPPLNAIENSGFALPPANLPPAEEKINKPVDPPKDTGKNPDALKSGKTIVPGGSIKPAPPKYKNKDFTKEKTIEKKQKVVIGKKNDKKLEPGSQKVTHEKTTENPQKNFDKNKDGGKSEKKNGETPVATEKQTPVNVESKENSHAETVEEPPLDGGSGKPQKNNEEERPLISTEETKKRALEQLTPKFQK